MKAPHLEKSTISAFAGHATVDLGSAAKLLDSERCEAGDFSDPHLRALWQAVTTIVRDGRRPDFFAVESLLGGRVPRSMLVEVLLESNEATGAQERMAAMCDAGARRRAIHALAAVQGLLADTSRPMTVAVTEAQKALESLHQQAVTSRTADSDLVTLADHLEQIDTGAKEPVMATGLPALDEAIGGLQKTLTIIGALPAVGKSGLIATLCRSLSARGVKVGLFSLEDERGWVARRLVSEVSKVPLFVLCNRKLYPEQKARVGDAMMALHSTLANLTIDDRPALTAADVIASARAMIVREGVQAIIVDHLGEIRTTRTERYDLDITEVLQQLRALAKVHGVPVVVACHIRRREGLLQQHAPVLTDFANSSGIERMARVALALSRPDEDTLAVHVLKQTSGPAGITVNLKFLGPSGTVQS